MSNLRHNPIWRVWLCNECGLRFPDMIYKKYSTAILMSISHSRELVPPPLPPLRHIAEFSYGGSGYLAMRWRNAHEDSRQPLYHSICSYAQPTLGLFSHQPHYIISNLFSSAQSIPSTSVIIPFFNRSHSSLAPKDKTAILESSTTSHTGLLSW